MKRSSLSLALIFAMALGIQGCSGSSDGGGGSGSGGTPDTNNTGTNTAPVITSADFSVKEKTLPVGILTATDVDGDTLYWETTGGTDEKLFDINNDTGALAFKNAPDFDNPSDANHDNVYELVIAVNDGKTYTQKAIKVTVTYANPTGNQVPVITSGNQSIVENTNAVAVLGATDPEGDTLTWSITGGSDQAFMALDATTGALTFLTAPDFETPLDADGNNVYEVKVTVSDGKGNLTSKALDVSVLNQTGNEAPVIKFVAPSVVENSNAVTTMQAVDQEGDPVAWSISGGADQSLFSINSGSGVLSFNTAPDYENPKDSDKDNLYALEVSANDGTNTVTKRLDVNVTNLAEPSENFMIKVESGWSGDNDRYFIIPVVSGENYNYNVDCDNDGVDEESNVTGSYKCIYTDSAKYTVVIKDNSGNKTGFPRIKFIDSNNANKLKEIVQWGDGRWSSMESAFAGAMGLNFTHGVVNDRPNLSHVKSLKSMFSSCQSFNMDIGDWNTSTVTDMSSMFNGAYDFNQDISKWDTSHVTDMSFMFYGASKFDQNLSSWDTSDVTDMHYMFSKTVFTGMIGTWNTSNVTDMSYMFDGSESFNQDISGWETSKVTNMSYMFEEAYDFNQSIGSWDTSLVTNMEGMFKTTRDFDQDIGSWDVGQLTNAQEMFSNAIKFNQDLGNWNTENVTTMKEMFYRAAALTNQDFSGWNVTNVTDHDDFSTSTGSGNIEPTWH